MTVLATALAVFTLLTVSSAARLPFSGRQYEDLTGNFSCAADNQATQLQSFPNWDFSTTAPGSGKQSLDLAWEPILEPVSGCNGYATDFDKRFTFLVVLDGSWVTYYNDNKQHFAKQGYPTLHDSPYLLFDRVTYIFERQFGVHVMPSRVVSFPTLGEACATNNKYADDGTDSTSTKKHLEAAGISTVNTDAGIIRIGVGSPNSYCHSHAGLGSLCNQNSIMENQKKPFATDGSGKINYLASRTLAHELGHVFGVCPSSNQHCLNGHTQNEIPDIMVWDGRPATNARPEGMFSKFLTTCTPLYDDIVCSSVKSATCGTKIPKISIAGEFVNTKYGAKANKWHFVTITEVSASNVFKWTNQAGVSWQLTRDAEDFELFHVSSSSPYYNSGHKTARITTITTKAVTTVTSITGPHNEVYTLKSRVSPSDPALCPSGNVDATCWADSAFQKCTPGQDAYDTVISQSSCGNIAMYEEFMALTSTGPGCPASSDPKPYDTSLCPNGNNPNTCWADSAYQKCPYDRQGAYQAVMAKKNCGAAAMYGVYNELTSTGIGCRHD